MTTSLLLACALAIGANAAAQSYPNKSVRIIVPASPSGGLDNMARVVSHQLAPMWGQAVVVRCAPKPWLSANR